MAKEKEKDKRTPNCIQNTISKNNDEVTRTLPYSFFILNVILKVKTYLY